MTRQMKSVRHPLDLPVRGLVVALLNINQHAIGALLDGAELLRLEVKAVALGVALADRVQLLLGNVAEQALLGRDTPGS